MAVWKNERLTKGKQQTENIFHDQLCVIIGHKIVISHQYGPNYDSKNIHLTLTCQIKHIRYLENNPLIIFIGCHYNGTMPLNNQNSCQRPFNSHSPMSQPTCSHHELIPIDNLHYHHIPLTEHPLECHLKPFSLPDFIEQIR